MKFEKIFTQRIKRLSLLIVSKDIVDKAVRSFLIITLSIFVISLIELFYNMNSSYRTIIVIITIALLLLQFLLIFVEIFRKSVPLISNDREKYIKLDSMFPDCNYLFLFDLLQLRKENKNNDYSLIENAISYHEIKYNSVITPKIFDKNFIIRHLFIPILIIVSLTSIFRIEPINNSITRLMNFKTEFKNPSSHFLHLFEKNTKIVQGDELLLSCQVSGKLPDQLKIHKRPLNSKDFTSLNIYLSDTTATFRERSSQSFYYFFSSEETTSDTGFVQVLKRPELTNVKMVVDFPSYTKLKSEEYQNFIGPVTVMKGSDITFFLEPSFEVDSLKIFANVENKVFSKKMNHTEIGYTTIEQKLFSDTEFYFKLYYSSDSLLIENVNPIIYRINILNDTYPTVNLILPEDNFKLDENLKFPVFATAFDDFSVRSVYLYYRKIPFFEDNLKNNFTFSYEKITYDQKSDGVCVVNTVRSINDLNLLPEDKVEIFLRVYDNDMVSGPKFSDSRHIFLLLPSLEQLFEETANNYEQQSKNIEKEKLRDEKIRETIEQLTQKLRKENTVEWKDQKELKKIAEEQNLMMENIKDIEKQIEQNIELLDNNTILSTETLKKYKQLKTMVSELFTKDMKDKLEKLSELSQKTDLDQSEMNELLNNFEKQQEEFKNGLDKTLEILKQIKQEYQLDRLIKLAEEMIKDQISVNEKIEEMSIHKDQIIHDESKIQSSFELLRNEISSFQKDMESEFPVKDLKELADKVNSDTIPQEFSELNKGINQGKKQEAGDHGEKLRDNFLEIKNMLTSVKDKMVEKKKDDISNVLDQIIDELLFISGEIEEIKNYSRHLAYNSTHAVELIRRNAEIENLFKQVNKNIFNIAKQTFFIDNTIIANIGRILEQFETISRILENRHFSLSTDSHKYIMGNVNKLIVLLAKAKENVNNSKSASGLEEMLKKMEELAAMQSSLNSDSQNTMQMGKSGESSLSKMQEMMNKLAQQQMQLSELLSKMKSDMGMPQSGENGKPGSEGSPGNSGMPSIPGDQGMPGQGNSGKNGKGSNPDPNGNGDPVNSALGKKLGGIGKSMNDVANELKNRKLDESVLNKQKQILNKLLDAIESTRREKYSNKRESKGSDKYAIDPGELELNFKNTLRENLIRSLKDDYRNDYKVKIKKYFKELEY
ncbi:MAG: hypothetical protein JXR69_04075 [Candidatus Delongbacteria bacterium]|nr:hypothetical protein [Candidatus Delongbacteria bacterium]